MKKIDRTGEIRKLEDGVIKIIKYNNRGDIFVKLEDGNIVHTRYPNFLKMKSSYPSTNQFKQIYNNKEIELIKKNTEKKWRKDNKKDLYTKKKIYMNERPWIEVYSNLLKRCNGDSEKYPTYVECKICDEWLNNKEKFYKWYQDNIYDCEENIQLDKDIKIKGNKLYSPNTCLLVPLSINSLFKVYNGKTKGVNKNGNRYRVYLNKFSKYTYFGSYSTEQEAYNVYLREKEKYIHEVGEKWKNKVPNEIYQILINYKLRN